MGDKDKSAKAPPPSPADPQAPTPEQVKQFDEWWRAQNTLGPTDPFQHDPRLALVLQQMQQQKAGQQTPAQAPRPVVFVDPASGGNAGGSPLPFPSSEAPAKPAWGQENVNKWFSDDSRGGAFVRHGFPLAKEGLAETGKMLALPFAWTAMMLAILWIPSKALIRRKN